MNEIKRLFSATTQLYFVQKNIMSIIITFVVIFLSLVTASIAIGVCQVPWGNGGDIEIRGQINNDLLTVNETVEIILKCRAYHIITNGQSRGECWWNNEWVPKIGVCVPDPNALSTTSTSTPVQPSVATRQWFRSEQRKY